MCSKVIIKNGNQNQAIVPGRDGVIDDFNEWIKLNTPRCLVLKIYFV